MTFLDNLIRLIGNIFGVVFELFIDIKDFYSEIVKRATLTLGAGFIIAIITLGIGTFIDSGGLITSGLIIFAITFGIWALATAPIWAVIQYATEANETLKKLRDTIIYITVNLSFLTVYVFVAHPWRQKELFLVLLVLFAFITFITLLIGKSINPETYLFRAKVVFFGISALIVANIFLPQQFIDRTKGIYTWVFGLKPNVIYYVLCRDQFNEPDLCDQRTNKSIGIRSTTTGKALVWCSVDDNGRFTLFDKPGFDPQTEGKPLPEFTLKDKKTIIAQLQQVLPLVPPEPPKPPEPQVPPEPELPKPPPPPPEPPTEEPGVATSGTGEEIIPNDPDLITTIPVEPVEEKPVIQNSEVIYIPSGTTIEVEVREAIFSQTAQEGDISTGLLAKPIKIKNRVIFPQRTSAVIEVAYVKQATERDNAILTVNLKEIAGAIIGISKTIKPSDYRLLGGVASTLIGALIGYKIDGKTGAIIGGASGGVGGIIITREMMSKIVLIKSGDKIKFKLARPLSIIVPS